MTRRAPRPPEGYVHGVDGPVVIVPARVAAWLDRAALADLRTRVRGVDPEVDAVLVALRVAAMSWRNRTADTGTKPAPTPAVAASWEPVGAVAERLGVGQRYVRQLLADGTLAGARVGSRWLIDPEGLRHYQATRQAS